jgi:hypothetical protein
VDKTTTGLLSSSRVVALSPLDEKTLTGLTRQSVSNNLRHFGFSAFRARILVGGSAYYSNMSSSRREEIQRDFDALRTVVSRIVGHSYDALTTLERLNLLERLEHETRRLRAPGHELTNQLAEQAGPEQLGGPLPRALADASPAPKRAGGWPRPPISGRAAP